jgi:hypothetical protein
MLLGLKWLLALLVLIASVDRVPDPPAAGPKYSQSNISISYAPPSAPAASDLALVTLKPVFDGGRSCHPLPVRRIRPAFAPRRATDSSPPSQHKFPISLAS